MTIKNAFKGRIVTFTLFFISIAALNIFPDQIYFSDTGSEYIIIGNDHWEAAFFKNNGGFSYIVDKSANGIVCAGSKNKALWAVDFFGNSDVIYASDYTQNSSDSFRYSWSNSEEILRFYYQPSQGSTSGLTAEVTITLSENDLFDLQLRIKNDSGSIAQYIYFPYDLAFSKKEIEEALYPILPGVIFKKDFFLQDFSYTARYPGWPGVFADLVSLITTDGKVAIYSIQDGYKFTPAILGFISNSDNPENAYFRHSYGSGAKSGEEYSTPIVRIKVGSGHKNAIYSYRIDNSFDDFVPLRNKLGNLYEKIVTSPLMKVEVTKLKLKFSEYDDLVFSRMPTPLIYHFCGFQVDGFDENVPDLLPPEPAWGTTDDLIAMVKRLQERGNLFMPYTNPTWWDDESPTLQNLPSDIDIKDIAVIHEDMKPVYETYSFYCGGYVISPFSPFVLSILDQKVKEMTEQVPSDALFEDQIGARQWWFDFNENSPSLLSYVDGWIEHTRKYKDKHLATELGFDRLAETETAYFGSILLPIREGNAGKMWGADNWYVYPMAPMLLRDKIMFYQHDLADYTMTHFKENFTWNISFGYFFTYQIVNLANVNMDWLKLSSDFSKYVLSHYADEPVCGFEYINDKLSKTDFESYEVYTNWDDKFPYSLSNYSIAPSGVLIKSKDDCIAAGIFTGYNGGILAGKEHYLIEERGTDLIKVHTYFGENTPIRIELLNKWQPSDRFKVNCYSVVGGYIGTVSFQIDGRYIIFELANMMDGQEVAFYEIIRSINTKNDVFDRKISR